MQWENLPCACTLPRQRGATKLPVFFPTLKPGRNIHRVPSRFSIAQLLLLHIINDFQRHFEVDVLAVGYVVAAGQISDARHAVDLNL